VPLGAVGASGALLEEAQPTITIVSAIRPRRAFDQNDDELRILNLASSQSLSRRVPHV
jgi:hypothetical protein